MGKNIVVFSDGTGQDGGLKATTNVYRIFNMVEDRTPHQIAFYDRGLGTGVVRYTGMVGGFGFARNVHDCYRFIFEQFQSGDRLFLIGFSRGAATVRSLSYFLHLFGILPHSRPELISHAWQIYKTVGRERREEKAAEFISRHNTMWTKIHFLGCFDTVAALGLPSQLGSVLLDRIPGFRHRFHSFELSPAVSHAFHALAIDDERKTFHPVLLDAEVNTDQTVRQVWFAGMHTDVGGGYLEQELSDIPLVWMTQKAVEHGLRIYPRHKVQISENADGFMHDSRGTRLTRLYRRAVRSWPAGRPDLPVVHASVLSRRRGVDNTADPPYAPWILEGSYQVEPWKKYEDQTWRKPTDEAALLRLPEKPLLSGSPPLTPLSPPSAAGPQA